MLLPPSSARKRSSRGEYFRAAAWSDNHPDLLRINASLPADHHARWLAAIVGKLDLTALRDSYKGYGSLALPVELLLAFVLFMYSKGICSPAHWANHARYDDQSKWLLRGLAPCRSLLYSFRDRTQPFLDQWHRQLIGMAVSEGLSTASSGSLDGTSVASLASRHQLFGPDRLRGRLLLLRLLAWFEQGQDQGQLQAQLELLPQHLLSAAALLVLGQRAGAAVVLPLLDLLSALLALLGLLSPADNPGWPVRLPAWLPATAQGRARVLRRYEEAQQRLARRLAPLRRKKNPSKKDQETLRRAKVSLSDPEAALGWDKLGTYRPLYNVLLVQATDAPLTLAFEVLPRNNDDGLLRPMMQKAKEQLGHHLKEALADGAFVSIPDALYCEQQEIVLYAPSGKAEASKAEAAGKKEPAKKREKIHKSQFRYDSAEGVYHCPEGKRLEAVSRTTQEGGGGMALPVIVHRAQAQDCQGCARRAECTSSAQKGRTVKRYEGEEALERIAERMETAQGKELYKLRKQSVELGYADIKQHRGLRVFNCFGIKRARAQAGLVILASNGLKLMRLLLNRQDSAPHPPDTANSA